MLPANGFMIIPPDKEQTYFTEIAPPATMQHHGRNFDDFSIQKLMTAYLSKTGPSMAVADVNKDGLEDIFFGGGRDQPSQLFIQNSRGMFNLSPQPAFIKDSAFCFRSRRFLRCGSGWRHGFVSGQQRI